MAAVYVGRFEDRYLEVPQECLILTMRTNQRYFPLFDAEGRLLPRFLIVSNMAIEDPSAIIDGNERVVRPRLADARFFYDQDRKTRLEDRWRSSTRSSITPAWAVRQRARVGSARSPGGSRRARPGSGSGQESGPAGQGGLADRNGRRVPGTARDHGPLLRPS
jgi:hypothetical protein